MKLNWKLELNIHAGCFPTCHSLWFFFFFWTPRPGTELAPLTVEALSPNHWEKGTDQGTPYHLCSEWLVCQLLRVLSSARPLSSSPNLEFGSKFLSTRSCLFFPLLYTQSLAPIPSQTRLPALQRLCLKEEYRVCFPLKVGIETEWPGKEL